MDLGRILIVEDNPSARFILELELCDRGYLVSVAENGKQALETLSDDGYRFLVIDIEMPEMDGLELLRNLKEDGRLDKYAVAVMTARSIDKVRPTLNEILGDRPYALLQKPFEIEYLEHQLRHLNN
jgi:chemosensory pili system protein ChpA (sensor histidine kinase/response regulator)